MRVGILTWGSEGDLRPFLALSEGLSAAGHDVRLAYAPAEGRDYSAQLAGARFHGEQIPISTMGGPQIGLPQMERSLPFRTARKAHVRGISVGACGTPRGRRVPASGSTGTADRRA